ncbi:MULTISPECIES: nucleotide exchange factor GrpE [unclassified Prochlorococcus]|uniref:nucleotide exchange factor GrpE n=1 Tax=unclassified Prochlorococcus TaxID=2627481 RepID=UPI000533831F|nr:MULTISPECIES: nucleotide exchange factor GrpE [unclassified Prochlorococcus]KGG16933.1 Heat shock protein GrpE [Prochlorococcus sp. MIT 0602]KGG18091.1 Heat shock protein GrpE [Prochlorococcus sp. MIT 0603]
MAEELSTSSQEGLEIDSNSDQSERIDSSFNEKSSVDSLQEDQIDMIENKINPDSTPNSDATSDSELDTESIKQPLDNEARLQQLESEHETLKSQYMRIAADFDNFRKRQTRDQDDLKVQLTCTTLSEILPVVDNFERARQQIIPEGEEALNLHRNYQNLYKQLVDVLKKLGVAPMRVVGQAFDPTLHEALLKEPSDEVLEDIIIEELVRGYHLNGRVLRHAQVKVSMGPGPKSNDEEKQIDEVKQTVNDNDSDDLQEGSVS